MVTLDGLILVLVKKLPPAGTTDWKAADRAMWLQTAAMAFQIGLRAFGSYRDKGVQRASVIPIRNGTNS
jgi:hypothetical protein